MAKSRRKSVTKKSAIVEKFDIDTIIPNKYQWIVFSWRKNLSGW
jgi:hypothetical protein